MPILRRLALPVTLLALACSCPAQTLARPGWTGSGMRGEPWWKRAVVYQLDPKSFSPEGLRGVSKRFDYIQSLGVDAILLDLGSPAGSPTGATNGITGNIDPALGTMDDLDDLIHQASSRSIRILIDLDPKAAELTSLARLWLTHGVAGFHVPGASPEQLAELKKLLNSFVGQRILVGDLDTANPQANSQTGPDSPQLVADPRPGTVPQLTAAAVRPALEASQTLTQPGRITPLLLSDGPNYTRSFSRYADGSNDIGIAKTLAAVLFATRAGTLLYYGQELGLAPPPAEIHWDAPPKVKPAPGQLPPPPPPSITPSGSNAALADADPASLLNWYRQLSSLHHSNRTISTGDQIILNHDDKNILAWVRKPPSVTQQTPAIVIVCNLSAQPVTISLKADMQRLRLRGSFLRTLLRSDNAMGAMHLDGMTIAPYTVYIGELHF